MAALGLLLFGFLLTRPCGAAGPPPVITVQPLSQTVLLNDSVTFTVVASSGTTMTYQWRKNGTNILGATLSAYTIPAPQYADMANYSVRVINAGGTIFSTNAALTVLGPPQLTTQPQDRIVVPGQNATFGVVAIGTAPLRYQWYFNDTALSRATNASLTFTNIQTTNAGSYSVVVTNSYGSVTSVVATLVVQSWIAQDNGSADDHDYLQATVVDGRGNVFVTGYAKESASGNYDFVTLKYDSSGNRLWRAVYDGGAGKDDQARALAVDAAGNVYVTGSSELSAGDGGWDYVTLKYDTNGNQLWASRFNSPASKDDLVSAIAVDASGNVFVTGSGKNAASHFQYQTVKYDSAGNQLWANYYC